MLQVVIVWFNSFLSLGAVNRGEWGELAPGAKWHPTCFCSRVCCQPMAMMFLCCTYTNQNTKNLWRPNPAWFKNYHDKPFLNHMSILFLITVLLYFHHNVASVVEVFNFVNKV